MEQVFVVSGNGFQLRLLGRIKAFAMVPSVVPGRDNPEVAIRVAHDPLLRQSIDKNRHDLLPYGNHVALLQTHVCHQRTPHLAKYNPGTEGYQPSNDRTTARLLQVVHRHRVADLYITVPGYSEVSDRLPRPVPAL